MVMASDLMNRRPRTCPRGFTLIEMMITIAVAVVLLAIVAPSFRQLIANQRIKTASFDLFSALNYARSEAIKRNAAAGVTLQAGALTDGAWATGWRIVDPADATKSLRSWGAINSLSVTEEAGGITSVTYGRDGRLAGGTAPRFELTTSPSISGVKARCVQVDLSGRPATAEGVCP
jgi:type IV fimbrial biogenesis protein FimT